jgi:ketosteroid isomerase-like protein
MGATEDAASRRRARSGGTRPHGESSHKAAENAELVRRIFDAFAGKQGFALRGLFADDATWVVPGAGLMAGTYRGRDEIFRFLGRLPKETAGTYGSRLIDVLASDDRAAAVYRAFGSRQGRTLDIDQVLLFRIEDGRVVHVLALPCDPAAFEEFWAA